VQDGCVFRVQKAYPVYDSDYRDYLTIVRQFVDRLEDFQTIGRNGLHRYNNQDHAMMTGALAVRNLMLGERNDLWSVNTEQEYHEEIRSETVSAEPTPAGVFNDAVNRVFSKLDPAALGVAVGITGGLGLFLATLILVIKGGPVVGPNLQLLNEFFPGYTVTLWGSLLGLGYAFITGFVMGSAFAYLRNVTVYLSALIIHRDIESHLLRRLLDYL